MAAKWHEESNYLIVLSVPDETSLERLRDGALRDTPDISVVMEPDYGENGELTAIALPPYQHFPFLSSLPLAGKPTKIATATSSDYESLGVAV